MPRHDLSKLGQRMQFYCKLNGYICEGREGKVKDYVLDALEGMDRAQARAHTAVELLREAVAFLVSRGWKTEESSGVLYLVSPKGDWYSNRPRVRRRK